MTVDSGQLTVIFELTMDNGQLTIDNFGGVRETFLEFYRVQSDDWYVKTSGNQHKFDAGAAISRPPRWMYNLWGRMVSPTLWYPHCSGGNLPPSGPQGRNRGTFVFVSSNLKAFVVVWGGFIQQNGLYSPRCQPLAGAGWRWVNAATLFRIWGNTIHRHRLLLPPLHTLTNGYK